MEDNKNYERGEHLENITDASMKDDDYSTPAGILTGSILLLKGARVK